MLKTIIQELIEGWTGVAKFQKVNKNYLIQIILNIYISFI